MRCTSNQASRRLVGSRHATRRNTQCPTVCQRVGTLARGRLQQSPPVSRRGIGFHFLKRRPRLPNGEGAATAWAARKPIVRSSPHRAAAGHDGKVCDPSRECEAEAKVQVCCKQPQRLASCRLYQPSSSFTAMLKAGEKKPKHTQPPAATQSPLSPGERDRSGYGGHDEGATAVVSDVACVAA